MPPRHGLKWVGGILLLLELVWMLFYVGVSIYAFHVSTDDFFMDPNSTAYGKDDIVRTSLRVFKSHLLVSGTIAAMVGLEWQRPRLFGIVFFIFLLYTDISNFVEVCCFSKIRSFVQTEALWKAAMALSIYQMTLTVAALIFYVIYVEESRRFRVERKTRFKNYSK